MGLKQLSPDERATYLLGLAVRRQLEEVPRDPDPETVREIAAVCRWLEHWLNERELLLIAQGTGHYFGDESDEPDVVRNNVDQARPPTLPNPDAERIDPEMPF